MKYLLSEIRFKAFVKGPNVGKEYAIATVSNADCDVVVKSYALHLCYLQRLSKRGKLKLRRADKSFVKVSSSQ